MNLQVGDVVSVYTTQSFNVKYKYIILVGIHQDNPNEFLGVFINSHEHNEYHLNFPKNNDRKYLDHDSFIDCSDPKRLSRDEIIDSLKVNLDNLRGSACREDIESIRQTLRACGLVKRVIKKYFLTDPPEGEIMV